MYTTTDGCPAPLRPEAAECAAERLDPVLRAVDRPEAEQSADALYNLGLLRIQAGAVAEAVALFRRAADLGSVDAAHNVGVAYYKPVGFLQSTVSD